MMNRVVNQGPSEEPWMGGFTVQCFPERCQSNSLGRPSSRTVCQQMVFSPGLVPWQPFSIAALFVSPAFCSHLSSSSSSFIAVSLADRSSEPTTTSREQKVRSKVPLMENQNRTKDAGFRGGSTSCRMNYNALVPGEQQ